MDHLNTYADPAYADSYARLEFPGTYYLVFRDLPELIGRHATGTRALDFGCGTGRSTRFLHNLGFNAVGVDIATEMVSCARRIDPAGDYRVVGDGEIGPFPDGSFDLVLAAFTFDNIATVELKTRLFGRLARALKPSGRMINLVSTPDIYLNEWASFSTRDFPENRAAKAGDTVRIINTALDHRRPAVDILCPDESYRSIYAQAGLDVIEVHRPLGRRDEPFAWVNETAIAPWALYVLGPARPPS